MGYVFLGLEDTGTEVIVKAPRIAGDSQDAMRLAKLKVEAELLRGLDHPNIVRYLDHRNLDGGSFLVVEYVRGRSFKEAFLSRPADEEEGLRLLDQLLKALKYLHTRNIIHRDINPKNLLLTPDGRLIMIDFGAAKRGATQLASSGTLIGTTGWSAPEQFTTGIVTPSCDLYSVGAVAFFLLTGIEPRLHMGASGALMRSPRDVNPRVSPQLAHVVRVAMDPDPAQRYQTAEDLLLALQGKTLAVGAPHLVVSGAKYPLAALLDIGRAHTCGPECTTAGFKKRPGLAIDDQGRRISKHHARIFTDQSGKLWLEDLGSLNGTAVAQGQRGFSALPSRGRAQLQDRDAIALGYSPVKGAYLTMMFYER